MNYKRRIHFPWLMRMAVRDSRKNRSRLLLFISSIVLGIAALVSIFSLGRNLNQNIDQQAAGLIGADLEISGNRPLTDSIKKMLDSVSNRHSEELNFASMIYFPLNMGTRLVQVRALKGEFPYYGELETNPVSAGKSFRNKKAVLVDQNLLLQYNAKTGDSVKIGNIYFMIAGSLSKAPGQTGLSASIAPVVYIPFQYMDSTGLLQKGSRIVYRFYYKYDGPGNIEKLVGNFVPRLEASNLNYNTIALQKESTGRFFDDLNRFLALVSFIALLLGCIGIASSIQIYIREKISQIAILRCLGMKGYEAFLIYLIQIMALGGIGSVVGCGLGVLIQQLLPVVLKDIIPVIISTDISWTAIGQGIGLGMVISILFSLLPLLTIRNISPLQTLRSSFQKETQKMDWFRGMVYLMILAFVVFFIHFQIQSWKQTIFFTLGLVLAFFTLAGIAQLLMWLVKKFFPFSWSYIARQGLANLFRPNNQTIVLIVSIGLGTALMCIVFFTQSILINRVKLSSGVNQPNIVLFDIQTDQKVKISALVKQMGLPDGQFVPVVNMRLQSVNSRTVMTTANDSGRGSGSNIFRREYRVTYRDKLITSEKIVAGKWQGVKDTITGRIPISIEQAFAKRNRINTGDTMLFNVQGTLMTTVVSSLRQVDWNRMQTNFLVVFPSGVLEDAPQFHVLLTRVPGKQASANFQQAIVRQFPNVSIIDLALVLSVLDAILDKIGFVIHFMAAFSIITGIVVLIASVLISKYQRIEEGVLLRTLGASRKQIFLIAACEYFFLGAFASAAGILLAFGSGWALAHYIFETSFFVLPTGVATVFISVVLLTVLIGLLNSREVISKPPLEVLRQEVS